MISHRERAEGVHTQLQTYLDAVAKLCPWEVVLLEGVRTEARQAALYAQGRTAPGNKVTNAEHASDTPHGRGAALDLVPRIDGHTPWQTGQPNHELFMARLGVLGGIAVSMGLTWGGNWHSLQDYDHVEIAGWRDLPMPS